MMGIALPRGGFISRASAAKPAGAVPAAVTLSCPGGFETRASAAAHTTASGKCPIAVQARALVPVHVCAHGSLNCLALDDVSTRWCPP